jgi:hypothetical protein
MPPGDSALGMPTRIEADCGKYFDTGSSGRRRPASIRVRAATTRNRFAHRSDAEDIVHLHRRVALRIAATDRLLLGHLSVTGDRQHRAGYRVVGHVFFFNSTVIASSCRTSRPTLAGSVRGSSAAAANWHRPRIAQAGSGGFIACPLVPAAALRCFSCAKQALEILNADRLQVRRRG